MMELPCAVILISASLVLATPHGYGGYGVKGGAAARAESSASAGAFGGIPVAVPLGAGYSGSFSKSSSSSSASSSASSSSSSNSFSYSGSGAGGLGLNGGALGHGGCSSGNCQTAGGNGIPAPDGSSAQGYNSANAAAAAGAVSGSGCQGLSCDGNSEKCKSGQCKPNLQTGTPSLDSDSNKCTSGQCASALENGASPADYGSNDIRAVTESLDSAHNANHQSSGIDKTSSAYNGADSDCSHEKCGPSGPSSSKPGYYAHDSGSSGIDKPANNGAGSDCSSGKCGPSGPSSLKPGYYAHDSGSSGIDIMSSAYNGAGSDCSYGKCGPSGSSSSKPGYYSHDSGSAGIDKTSSAYNGAGSDCSHGKCGPSGPSSVKPGYYDHDSGNSYQGSSAANNQQASSSDTGITSHYQKPSTHLETPKFGSKCNSGNCDAGPHEPGHETSPSSYNVPIHGAYDKGEPKPSCDGVKCENQPKGLYSPTDNSVTKGPTSFDYPSSTNCAGSSCFRIPANKVTGGPSFTASAGSVNFGTPANTVASGPSLTVRPGNVNFGTSPSHETTLPAGSNVAPGHVGHGKPIDVNNKLLNDKLPPYTGGFGGPAGILNPNEYDVHSPTANPSYGHASTPQNGKPLGSGPTGCNSPSCSGHPSASGPTGGPVPTSTYNHRPGGDIPSEKLPPYTGGFGGPTGMLKPNEFDVHATVTNKPTYGHPGSPSHNTQSPFGNIGTTGCEAGGNCGGYSPSAGATSGASASSGYYGTTKPNNGINSPNDKQPTYTGGFGGPGGVFNPDKHDIHSTGPSSPGYTPSGTYNSPESSVLPGGCKTANCYPSSGSTAIANAQAKPFGVTKPSSGPHISSVTLPTYPSGYDRPSGLHRPNEISSPASTPSFAHTQSPSSPGSYSPGCKTGNCANYPSSLPSAGANAQPASYFVTMPNTDVNPAGPTHPQYTGGFGGTSGTFNPNEHNSPGCKTGNCANYPTSVPSAGVNAQPGSFGVTKPNTDVNPVSPTHPQYTGGFGGPSGTFNPNEHNSPGCKTGNCANYPTSVPSAGVNVQPGSFGVTQPNTDVNPAGPTHPQYTGGFGGPSGTFNPNEHNSPGCKTGNCANYPTSVPSAGVSAQPGSFGITKPNTHVNPAAPTHPQYTGGFGGPSGTFNPNEHNSPGCKTGNCANYPTSVPSAGVNAQPGSFGVTKPNTDVNPAAPTHPQYTGGFGGPSGTFKPSGNTVTPSTGSAPANCKTPNCVGSPTASADAISGANAQSGSYSITKPSAGNNPSNEKPIYTGGFGGATGLLKPNEYTVPAVNPTLNNKPGASTPAACTSGNCNPQAPHGTAPQSQNGALSGAHATAAAAAEANAIAYTGGFGGPPGLLAPYDDGKIGALPSNGGHAHGPQIGGAHGSHGANIHSQHGTIPSANGSPPGPAGTHRTTGAQAGSNAGATAYAGAAASASAGAHGYNLHGSNYNHAGNVKGGSPCGGGCGGSDSGAYNGGSTLQVSGGHGFPKLVFSGGLNGAGSTSGATAKSLSGANAFGVGGSYASSSASAHASAGAYSQGGYGKR